MRRFLILLALAGCGPQPIEETLPRAYMPVPAAPQQNEEEETDAVPVVTPTPPRPSPMPMPEPTPDPMEPPCPEGVTCVSQSPFTIEADTRTNSRDDFDAYNCAATTPEKGREHVYRVKAPKDGWLSAAVYDTDADVDVHILKTLDANDCLARGHHGANADVDEGYVYVVVDSFTTAAGVDKEGPYRLDIGFLEPSRGSCAMQVGTMPRVNDGGDELAMPATGKIVMEAHLVTAEEPAPYPASSTDELADHYALSQQANGFVMYRSQVWAPLEGGSFYGAGISSPSTFPIENEAFYVCMYWRSTSRPAKGTRMILRKPGTTRAVVVAAGHETGPGNLDHIGGTTEETHYYLGTQHHSVMQLGLAEDGTLPLGPRVCTD